MNKFTIKMGPFNEGMNNKDRFIGYNQMRQITNFEIAHSGALQLRRPFYHLNMGEVTPDPKNRVLGNIVDTAGLRQYVVFVYNGRIYAIASGASFLDVEKYDLGTVPTIDDVMGIVTYDRKYWLIGRDITTYSAPIQLFNASYTPAPVWTELTTGPTQLSGKLFGNCYVIYKERLFVASGGSIYYSAPYDWTKWVNPDGGLFKLGSGLGETVNFMSVGAGAVFFFSPFRTYSLQFDDDILTTSVLRQMNQQGARLGCTWRDRLFVYSSGTIYEYESSQYFLKKFDIYIPQQVVVNALLAVDDGILLFLSNSQIYFYYPLYQSYVEFNTKLLAPGNSLTTRNHFIMSTVTSNVQNQFTYSVASGSLGYIYLIPYNYYLLGFQDFYDVNEAKTRAYLYDLELITGEFDAQNPHMVKILPGGYLVGKYKDQVSSVFKFYGLKENSKVTHMNNIRTFDEVLHFTTPDKRTRIISLGMDYTASSTDYITYANRTDRYFDLQYILLDVTMIEQNAQEQGV